MQNLIKKPLLLIFPFNVLAHYLRCIQLAKHLQLYFDVKFLYSRQYSSFVDKHGYATFNCDTFDADNVISCIRKFDFSWLNKNDIEKIYLQQKSIVEELQPVAILGDTMPTLKMVAEETGIKYISLMNGYISRYHADVHQMPASHPLYKYCKNLPAGILNFFVEKGEQLSFREIHRPFRELRSKYRLSEKHSYEDELEGDINLLCDLPELFPQKKLPNSYYHIPPLFYENDTQNNTIAAILNKNKKTIFVSMGSTGDWSKAFFLNHPYFENYNIITAGDKENVIKGVHIIRQQFVNVHDLFPFVDLVICHGGNGTIYQSLLYGIPLLCKTAHFEQQWNVHKLEKMQLGQSLDKIKKDEDVIAIVKQWLGKKKNKQLSFIENKIREALESFPAIINKIIQDEFFSKSQKDVLKSIAQAKKIA